MDLQETQPLSEQAPTPGEALRELHDILQQAATTASPQRVAASRYTICRDILLKSDLRGMLPGFLLQCLTISRFHDFIHLLDPDVKVRLQFLDEAFEAPGALSRAPAFDVFGDSEY